MDALGWLLRAVAVLVVGLAVLALVLLLPGSTFDDDQPDDKPNDF